MFFNQISQSCIIEFLKILEIEIITAFPIGIIHFNVCIECKKCLNSLNKVYYETLFAGTYKSEDTFFDILNLITKTFQNVW